MEVGRVVVTIGLVLVVLLVVAVVGHGGEIVADKEAGHVVGSDRGWDPSSDLAAWSSSKEFRVGDKLWFTYSVAQGNIVELKSKEEYESCDLSNPIKMYTDGLEVVSLIEEGIRYFVSSKTENCKRGLKLHVEVMPKNSHRIGISSQVAADMAMGPNPSGSAPLIGGSLMVLLAAGVWAFYVGFYF